MKMWRFFKRNHVNTRLFHNVFKRDIWLHGNQRSTRDVICKIAQFKMADVKNFEAIFQRVNWLKLTKDPQIGYMSCMYALNDYEVPKVAFFGFTCPLKLFQI